MDSKRKKVVTKKAELQEAEEKLFSVEERWIKNEINKDTYGRWHSVYSDSIFNLKLPSAG